MSSRLAARLLLGLFGFAMVTLAWGPIAGIAALAAFGLLVFALLRWSPAARRKQTSQGPPPRPSQAPRPRPSQGPRGR
jgi:hypothetical protein